MYPETDNKSFYIFGLISNRCELFYRVTQAVQSDKTPRITVPKAIGFHYDILEFSKMTNQDLLSSRKSGAIHVRSYTTRSEELIQYLSARSKKNSFLGKIANLPIIRNVLEGFSHLRQNKEIYGYLAGKYETISENTLQTKEKDKGLEVENEK